MNKLLYLASLLLVVGVGKSMAGQGDLFRYDAVKIESEMAQLDQLEHFLFSNPGTTLSQLTETDGFAALGEFFGDHAFMKMNAGIGGFWWGFWPSFCLTPVFGAVAVAVVYVLGKDPVKKKRALTGCVMGSVLNVAILGFSYYKGWIPSNFSVF